MDQRSNSRLSLFLMELIVAIMFFSLSAAVCVRLFASAHILADNTENLSNATIWSQNLAESFAGHKGNLKEIGALYSDGVVTYNPNDPSQKDGSIVLFFNEKWEPLGSLSGSSYVAFMITHTEDAKDVYSDVTDYNVNLVGKASVGEIYVLDIRTLDESEYENTNPLFYENTIMKLVVDTYLGKEDG